MSSTQSSSENKDRWALRRIPLLNVLCSPDSGAARGCANSVAEEDDIFNLKLFFRYGEALRYVPPGDAPTSWLRCGDTEGESLGLRCGESLGLRSEDSTPGLCIGLLIGRNLKDPSS